ncbi:MAG: hypothetical protein WC971_05195 [Coriobacteriia bacterium]
MQIAARVCHYERMNYERFFARVFVALGGVFWIIAAFSSQMVFRGTNALGAMGTAVLPLGITVGALVVGWFFERVAGIALLAGAVASLAWGLVAGWEAGVWWTTLGELTVPLVVSGVLFLLAARMQDICASATARSTD